MFHNYLQEKQNLTSDMLRGLTACKTWYEYQEERLQNYLLCISPINIYERKVLLVLCQSFIVAKKKWSRRVKETPTRAEKTDGERWNLLAHRTCLTEFEQNTRAQSR